MLSTTTAPEQTSEALEIVAETEHRPTAGELEALGFTFGEPGDDDGDEGGLGDLEGAR